MNSSIIKDNIINTFINIKFFVLARSYGEGGIRCQVSKLTSFVKNFLPELVPLKAGLRFSRHCFACKIRSALAVNPRVPLKAGLLSTVFHCVQICGVFWTMFELSLNKIQMIKTNKADSAGRNNLSGVLDSPCLG